MNWEYRKNKRAFFENGEVFNSSTNLTMAENLEKIREEIRNLGAMYFKKNTVAPKSSIEGLIAVETLSLSSDKAYYAVTVSLNEDTHKFRILRIKE